MQPAMSAARGLRFCAALRGSRRFLDLVDFVAKAPPDGRGGRLASFFDGLSRALATRPASTRCESVFSERRECGGCGYGNQLGYQRALQQLYEHFASVRARLPAA